MRYATDAHATRKAPAPPAAAPKKTTQKNAKKVLLFSHIRDIIIGVAKHARRQIKYVAVCIMDRYIAYGDDSLTLRLVSKLPDLRVANAKWIQ